MSLWLFHIFTAIIFSLCLSVHNRAELSQIHVFSQSWLHEYPSPGQGVPQCWLGLGYTWLGLGYPPWLGLGNPWLGLGYLSRLDWGTPHSAVPLVRCPAGGLSCFLCSLSLWTFQTSSCTKNVCR